MKLEDLKPNDQIVIDDGYGRLSGTVVKAVNSKWIETINGKKFNRRNGRKWGDSDNWRAPEIARTHKGELGSRELMGWDEAREIIAAHNAENKRLALANTIKEFGWKSLPLETLQKVADIIGYKPETDRPGQGQGE